jgi:large repetitive protein
MAIVLTAVLLLGTLAPTAQAANRGSWETRAPAPTVRHESSFVRLGTTLHLLGGKRKQHHVYDPSTDSWSKKAPMPLRVNRVQAVMVAGKIYMIGGMIRYKAPTIESNKVQIYDPATDSWSEGAPMPRPRSAGGIAVHKGRIYYAGGISKSTSVKWLDVYNPATDTWRSLPDMPVARDHFHATVVGGSLYAIGGRQHGTGKLVKRNDRFNISAGSWRKKSLARVPVPVAGYGVAKMGRAVVLFGGVAKAGAKKLVQSYNPRKDKWRRLKPMPTPRHAVQAARCGSGVYLATGSVAAGRHPTDRHDVFFLKAPTSCPP